ncbi:MAG: hypothetical protein CMJ89_12585 [Planctomycetes bacterium]|jgi:hypothetical protein|nr:hypothetical protein [Planctomycetota bacterium]
MLTLAMTLLTLTPAPPPASASPPPVLLKQEEDETPVVDKRPEIKQLLDRFQAHTKKRGAEDLEAIGVIDELLQEFPNSGPKDRKAIVKGLDKCFKLKRTKELEPGVPDVRLYTAAAVAMGRMGPESVKPLSKQLGAKAFRKRERLLRTIALALGTTENLEAVGPLLSLLKHHNPTLVAAGAEALSHFNEAPLKLRKEMFSEQLKILMGQKATKDIDPTNVEAHERWNRISGPIVNSLQKLSGHDERDPESWQTWWNKNKKKDWDTLG